VPFPATEFTELYAVLSVSSVVSVAKNSELSPPTLYRGTTRALRALEILGVLFARFAPLR
jgi:hypothetical protein